jgi:iron-sulfur cluster repair protein YtfE (RIC family)
VLRVKLLSKLTDVIVHGFHNAFRKDIYSIDSEILRIRHSGGDIIPLFDRLQTFAEFLDYHARAEEAAVFPAFDKLTPSVTQTYLLDHRELDNMTNRLEQIHKSPDFIAATRATAVLQSHLRIHLDKEDAYIYPVLEQRLTDDDQVAIINTMASKVPPEKFAAVIKWLFPLLNLEDQVLVTKAWSSVMPPQVFAGVKRLIEGATGQNWALITNKVPELK